MATDQEPITRAGVFEIVRASLADILEIEASTISEGQSFVDDLEADSLALIELVEALVRQLPLHLGTPRAVRHGAPQQARLDEVVPDPRAEAGEVGLRDAHVRSRRLTCP